MADSPKYEYGRVKVSSQLASFDSAIREAYSGALRDLLNDTHRQLFWDGSYGPPDPRPFYGPPEPPGTVCGDISCRCCAEWREQWDDHCC